MKTQFQFGILVCGRHYSKALEREDTTSGEDTTSVFCNPGFERQYSKVRKREDKTSSPIAISVECSETNETIMPRIRGECSSVVVAVFPVVLITILESIKLV
jgi:hypothetical protein